MNEHQTILMVDDCEDDRNFMREAFRQAGCRHPLQEARDGEEAIRYLTGEAPYADRNKFPLPLVMLLDLNMPKLNGYEVLTWTRAQSGIKHLPIIILTASTRIEDVERAFFLGASSFLVKPSNLATLTDMARRLCEWIQINHFPPLNPPRKK